MAILGPKRQGTSYTFRPRETTAGPYSSVTPVSPAEAAGTAIAPNAGSHSVYRHTDASRIGFDLLTWFLEDGSQFILEDGAALLIEQ